ncbi:vacuolar transporter chaperone [Saitoella coloradoensis]
MKFGQQLKLTLNKEYRFQYVEYDSLKFFIKERLGNNNNQWNEEDEAAFVHELEGELDKVYTFQQVKAKEIERRIRMTEADVDKAVAAAQSEGGVGEDEFIELEQELSDIIADVHDLANFSTLNYTAFQKIIKKHDKQTHYRLKPIFAARLNAKPFFKENYDAQIVHLSKLYDVVRTRGNPVKGDSSAGGSQQNFVRQTTKYWVHPQNVTELKLIILKHLPVLVFNPNKEFSKADSAISSIYYDNEDLELYTGRLEKSEGAEAIRMRWYGGMDANTIFVERKTHREDWTGEKSVKARFAIKEKNLNAYLKGEYPVEKVFEKMRAQGKDEKEIRQLEQLAREVQYSVITKKYRPVVRSFYNRTAFQLPGDARVRISLDTELAMTREDNFDGQDRTSGNWRRTDIGIDWPFSQLPDTEVERFPYAVLEVKLQTQLGQEPPEWIRQLVASHLVEPVPKFSKFIHGTARLLYDHVELLPFWYCQMDVDIRKPVSHRFGIERPAGVGGGSEANTTTETTDDGNLMDEEERLERGLPEGRYPALGEEETEHTPLLERRQHDSGRAARERRHRPGEGLRQWLDSVKTYVNEHILRKEPEGDPRTAVTYARTFRAPRGKKIAVPVRVEPKVQFALERTFLSWMEFSILLGAIAAGLLNFGDSAGVTAAIGFTAVSALAIVYSAVMFLWRAGAVRRRKAVDYDDWLGPGGLCFVLVLAVGVNFWLRLE